MLSPKASPEAEKRMHKTVKIIRALHTVSVMRFTEVHSLFFCSGHIITDEGGEVNEKREQRLKAKNEGAEKSPGGGPGT